MSQRIDNFAPPGTVADKEPEQLSVIDTVAAALAHAHAMVTRNGPPNWEDVRRKRRVYWRALARAVLKELE